MIMRLVLGTTWIVPHLIYLSSSKECPIGKIPYYQDPNPSFPLAAAALDAAARSADADAVWKCNICMRLCVWD